MGIKNPPRHDPQSSVGWLLQSNIRFSIGPDLQDCIVWSQIFISIHISHFHNIIYLTNAYRVLLTRARQGFIIYIPEGVDDDATRKHEFYDPTFNYFRSIGIPEI